MMPNGKNTKRVILALDQAYEKFIQLEDKSTDEAEIVSYRCLYTNIYESKLYVEQMQKEIDRLKAEKNRVIEQIESEIHRLFKESGCVKDDVGIAQYQWLINGYQSALDMIKDGEHET